MDELTAIGDYEVREIERVGAVVRYAATHVVLPRQAVVELLAPDAPRADAMRLMRRACILEALQHPAVPRVFECGRLAGRPWLAISIEGGTTLYEELQHRPLAVAEVLALLEEAVAFLSHAHARGVLHGNITSHAIVREPRFHLLRWENARVHDTELASDEIDGCEDVFALGRTVHAALAGNDQVPVALTRLVARMLAPDATRPTAAELVTAVRELRTTISVDRAIEGLAAEAEDEAPEIEIEYPAVEAADEDYILLERHHVRSVIVDLEACG